MMTREFKINDAYLDAMAVALHPKTSLFACEGTIRSQKTVTMIQAFFEAVQDSNERLHLIAAQDLDAVRDNVLQSDFGLETVYPDYTSREREEFGGYYLKMKCDIFDKPMIKKILLCGFSRADHWKKILGKTLGVIFVDEVNNANEQFIDECFARQASADDPKTFWTLNGDVPTHYIYQKYINRCIIIGDAPASIRADMDKFPKERGWYYRHWKMEDNPAMTLEKIERTKRLYPVDSYYAKIKILGERGSPGKMLYLEYMDAARHIKPLDVRNYQYFGIGFDIGATRAFNSIALWGYKYNHSKIGGIDKTTFKQCGYTEKTKHLIAFVKRYRHLYIKYISVDSAELNYIQDLKALFSREFPEIQIIASYKATIKQRVDLGIIMFSHDQIEFNDTPEGRDMYDAFMVAKRSEKENEAREDNNERHIDIIDSCEYSWTAQMNGILLASKKSYERLVS